MHVLSVDVEGDFGTDRLRGVDEEMPRLLDAFESRGIRAVLFVVGQVAQQRPALFRQAAERGHLIGSHSMTHQALGRTDVQRRRSEVLDSKRAIEDATGVPCTTFRAPFFDATEDLGALLEEAGYAWSSSKAPFSPIARYRWWKDSAGPHRLARSSVVELPVTRVLGLPMPDGLSYRRLFWPLTALARQPPAMFYLHPYELLDGVDEFGLPGWMRAATTFRQGAWARQHLWNCIDSWQEQGARFSPPTAESLACVT